MAVSKIRAEFCCEAEKLWNIVTSLDDFSWRSDIDKIVVLEAGKQFEEYTRDGYVTKFTITVFEYCKRYEFDMENSNMEGHWTGIFSYENGKTMIDFTEEVIAKKFFMKPFLGGYLKKQQAQYIRDLNCALNNSVI